MTFFHSDSPYAPPSPRTAEDIRLPPPEYWKNEYRRVWPKPLRYILKALFTLLCLIAFGRKTLDYKWETMQDDSKHDKYTETLSDRLTTLSVVVSSLHAAPSSWRAQLTRAVVAGEFAPVLDRGPRHYRAAERCTHGLHDALGVYVPVGCLWRPSRRCDRRCSRRIHHGHVLYALGQRCKQLLSNPLAGNSELILYLFAPPQTLMGSRLRVWSVLIILAYPFFSIVLGVGLCVVGKFTAVPRSIR